MIFRYMCICAAIGCSTMAASAAGELGDYAYAWPLTLPSDSAAYQVELTPDVYAWISEPGLRDVEVFDAAGQPVPLAPRAAETTTAMQATFLSVPQFVLPLPPASARPGVPEESISLHIERGPDGRLRRLDAAIGRDAQAAPGANSGAAHEQATAPRLRDPAQRDDTGAATADFASGTELLLDASAIKAAFDSVRLDWADSGANLTAQFTISASDDLQQWHTLIANATVLTLRQDGNVLSHHDIALGGAHAAYLRLHRLDDGSALPNLTARVRTSTRSTLTQPAQQWLDAAFDGGDPLHLDTRLPPGDGGRPVAYRYHLTAPLAVDALKLELTSDNSLARVQVLSRARPGDGPGAWAQRADFVAFKLRQGDAIIANDETSTSFAPRSKEWRVEFSTPLDQAPTLRVSFRPERLVFLAQGKGPYRLAAGSARARHSEYPVDTALAQLRAQLGANWQPPLATLGAREALQGERALTVPAPEVKRDWKTWMLWAVLLAGALLVAGLALSLLRQQPPKSGGQRDAEK